MVSRIKEVEAMNNVEHVIEKVIVVVVVNLATAVCSTAQLLLDGINSDKEQGTE